VIEALSSRPDQVTGGGALVRVNARDRVRVTPNGRDITDALTPDRSRPGSANRSSTTRTGRVTA
jgi:hypothetical protein